MATAIACDMCQQENAVLLQTNIGNGDVIAVGPSCVLVFLLTTAESITAEMPADNAAAYGSLLAPILGALAGATSGATEGQEDAIELDEDPITGDMAPIAGDGATAPPAGPVDGEAVDIAKRGM